jgi:hypothetical protein
MSSTMHCGNLKEKIWSGAFICVLLFPLVACQREDPAGLTPESGPSPFTTPSLTSVESQPAPSPPFSVAQICKAGIGLVMGRDPLTMDARELTGLVTLSYVRSDDGTRWSYRCRLDGDRIIWASDTGRWRTHPLDGVLQYTVSEHGSLLITESYSDGSSRSRTFSTSGLGP